MYTVKQLASLWHVGTPKIRKLFRGRQGVVNLSGNPGRPVWRIPLSVAVDAMVESGYTYERATRILHRVAETSKP
jgi:hypothetical protein